MIEFLKIRNFILIEKAEVEFNSGFNVITGETGAGKSIFVNAMGLILGEKFTKDMIGKFGKESIVEAQIKLNSKLKKRILSLVDGIELDESVIIKRVLSEEKNKIYMNDELISAATLKKIFSNLIDICSQHENQSILSLNNQLNILDEYANSHDEREKVKVLFKEYSELIDKKESLEKESETKEKRIDYIKYQLSELQELKLSEKDLHIEQKISQLKHQEEIIELKNRVDQIYSADNAIKDLLKELEAELKALQKYDNTVDLEKYKEVKNSLEDFIESIDLSENDESEDSLNEMYDRYEKITKLKKKFGGTIESMIQEKEKLESELDTLENFDQALLLLEKDIKKIEKKLNEECSLLSKKRQQIIPTLNSKITKELKDLNMPSAIFKVSQEKGTVTEAGFDKIEFMFSPNKGEEILPIKEIASGGELSRVILSIRNILHSDILTYVFDEVDSGIGGDTGILIGGKLKSVSKKNQVIVITHLHQVAAFSNGHVKIEKKEDKKSTTTIIKNLETEQEKVLELARMLGSSISKEKALDYAQFLYNQSQK